MCFLLRRGKSQPLLSTFTIVCFLFVNIRKTPEVRKTWTNLTNYELCALSSRGHTGCQSQLRGICVALSPRTETCIRRSMAESVLMPVLSTSAFSLPGRRQQWIQTPRSWLSGETAQTSEWQRDMVNGGGIMGKLVSSLSRWQDS